MADAIDPNFEHASGSARDCTRVSTGATSRQQRRWPNRPSIAPPSAAATPAAPEEHPALSQPEHPWRKRLLLLALAAGLVDGAYALTPAIKTALNTISTDDAYVDGHVTFVAARVTGTSERGIRRR